MCKKQLITRRAYAPALSAPTPTNANSAAANASQTTITQPLSTLNFVIAHDASLLTTCSHLPTVLKKLTSSTNLCERHGIIFEAVSSCCNVVSVLRSIIFY